MYTLPNGMTKVPWGFEQAHNGILVPTETAASRFRRAELGEAAIALLARLGVTEEMLLDAMSAPDPIARLTELQGEQL